MSRELNRTLRIAQRIERTESRTGLFALGRSLLALSQLCVLVFNSDAVLFGSPEGPRQGCTGAAELSLWCVSGSTRVGLDGARVLALVVLCVVVAGYRPSWSCVPHWYVSVSMSTCITAANGGEFVAQAATLLLIPACLGDTRRWHWAGPRDALSARWAGRSAAAHFALRCQVAVIYIEAAVSKLANPAWRDGRAMPAVFGDPFFGLPYSVSSLAPARAVLSSARVMTAMGWGIVAVELLIAGLAVGPVRFRRAGLLLVVVLHTGIMAFMGLLPFSVAMCALGALAAAERLSAGDRQDRFPAHNPEYDYELGRSNTAMLSANERLGFKPVRSMLSVEADLEELRSTERC